MGERIQALAQALTGKPSVGECTLEELQHLAQQYPYFAPAQFLLLQKLKVEGSPEYAAQQRKTILYFHDPLQFEALVSSEKFFGNEIVNKGETSYNTSTERDDNLSFQNGNRVEASEHSITDENPVKHNAVIITNGDTPSNAEPSKPDNSETKEHEESDKLIETSDDEPVTSPVISTATQHMETSVDDNIHIEHKNGVQLDEKEKAAYVDENLRPATSSDSENAEQTYSHKKPGEEADNIKETSLLFEPYHTVDYFASQGIKITADELPKDKLGKQLRSFTEWLKIMKRLPAIEMTKAPESTAEKTVENMANHSVEGSEVVTETMAEVWAKQGAREKAIETYNKLSLLYPSKRIYFAAKIENLKQS